MVLERIHCDLVSGRYFLLQVWIEGVKNSEWNMECVLVSRRSSGLVDECTVPPKLYCVSEMGQYICWILERFNSTVASIKLTQT